MEKELADRLAVIEARNRRVEADKAWEGSFIRRLSIATMTYVVVFFYGLALGVDRPYLNAAVPAAGFLLSTVTLPAIKRRWIGRRAAMSAP